MAKLANPQAFYDSVRGSLFNGWLLQSQVDGINRIVGEFFYRNLSDPRWLANGLAQTYHEGDKRMTPIEEYGGDQYFFQMYDIAGARPGVARQLGNLQPGDGVKYHGRGDIMITGRSNYAKMGKILGIDLENKPQLALDPAVSAAILWEGMTKGDSGFGDFTGASLDQYFNDQVDDPLGARRIVNGTDKADLIAGYHRLWLAGVLASGIEA